MRINELWQQCADEQQSFRVGGRGQEAFTEEQLTMAVLSHACVLESCGW